MSKERTESEAKPKRPTYRQVWPAYNAAQTGEKRFFQELLSDLCGTITEPTRAATGRPRIPLADAIFAAAFKVYSTVSGRRFTCDLRDAQEKGHVDQAPHYNSVFRVFEDATVTPILRELILRSSQPLTAVESDFAVDSSGFSSSRFERWFDAKYGIERSRATWVKTHICIGVRTQIVTAVELGNDHDSKMFGPLVEKTAESFKLGNVTADKAYLSNKNTELVHQQGGTPFIPIKTNTDCRRKGETWRQMFHLFHLHRDEFLRNYHQRSNVESAFSMIKRKFGDAVRSKTPVAMANEVLAKVLCHNICCLIQEAHELGIDPRLENKREEREQDAPSVLRFPGIGWSA